MRARRVNDVYLPGCTLPATVSVTPDVADAVARPRSDRVRRFPSHGCRVVIREAAAHAAGGRRARQRDEGSRGRHAAADVGSDRAGGRDRRVPVVVLSGPSFAVEVARQLPTAILAASSDAVATRARAGGIPRSLLSAVRQRRRRRRGDWRRDEEHHRDCRRRRRRPGARTQRAGGADHARPRRGLAAGLRRRRRGATRWPGLSGLGDLVLTCTGDLSRNRRVGLELAKGRSLPEILAATRMVAEGVRTTGAALALGVASRRRAADRDADGRSAGRPRRTSARRSAR